MSIRDLWAFDNRWELLLQRVLFRGTHLQVHRIGGYEMLVDHRTSDAGSIRQCVSSDMYRRFLPALKIDGPVSVLDIGANAGGFPLMLAASGIAIRHLVCVEMNPNTYERLRFNVRTNFHDRSEVVHAAVCASRKTIPVMVGLGSTNDSIYKQTKGSAKQYDVAGVTFDDVARRMPEGAIDVCKIDVEGAEHEILCDAASANGMLSRCRNIIMEVHHERQCEEIFATLAKRGFEVEPAQKAAVGSFLFVNRGMGK
jgi:FkbM family methyltransferase